MLIDTPAVWHGVAKGKSMPPSWRGKLQKSDLFRTIAEIVKTRRLDEKERQRENSLRKSPEFEGPSYSSAHPLAPGQARRKPGKAEVAAATAAVEEPTERSEEEMVMHDTLAELERAIAPHAFDLRRIFQLYSSIGAVRSQEPLAKLSLNQFKRFARDAGFIIGTQVRDVVGLQPVVIAVVGIVYSTAKYKGELMFRGQTPCGQIPGAEKEKEKKKGKEGEGEEGDEGPKTLAEVGRRSSDLTESSGSKGKKKKTKEEEAEPEEEEEDGGKMLNLAEWSYAFAKLAWDCFQG